MEPAPVERPEPPRAVGIAPGVAGPLPLVEELPTALEPWEAARRLAHWPNLLFLDSAAPDHPWSRYSFVAANPFFLLSYSHFSALDPFPRLQEQLDRYHSETLPDLPPFQGGLAGLFGYELCHYLERLPWPRFDDFQAPLLVAGMYDWVVSFDHQQKRAWLISTGFPETTPEDRRERAARRLSEVLETLRARSASKSDPRPCSWRPLRAEQLCPQYPLPGHAGVTSNFSPEDYRATIRRGIEYVHAGDCFQVNLSQRLLVPMREHPLELYARLRECNPAPFAGYFHLGGFAVASASPERFLRLEHGEVQTELLDSAKDRAENVMIVDLLRNDLGRVCSYGSVRVEALCRLESFRYVHHLVSEVRGRLRPGAGPIDLLRAAFPGGSVTGAPKVRAMEIIAELEPTCRGPYCGSLGYIGFDGSMDTNLLIRTFTIGRGWVQFPVGGGIVADSTPEAEYAETLHKAEGLLRALPTVQK
jgi:para-aminobenzoate synthetase component 1